MGTSFSRLLWRDKMKILILVCDCKNFLSLFLLTIVLLTNQTPAQNWFPSHVGDQWQYLKEYDEIRFSTSEWYITYSLINFSITEDTVLGNKAHYIWSKIPNYWLRYDSLDSKLYIWYIGIDTTYLNFSFDRDTTIWLFDPVEGFGHNFDISNDSIIFNDTSLASKIFHYHFDDGHYDDWDYNLYFSPDIGFIHYRYKYQSEHSQLLEETYYSLLQANIDGKNYSENYYPEIIAEPVVLKNISNFIDTIQVKHHYNHFFPANSGNVGINFIDSVIIQSFYAKGDSVINNPVKFAVSFPDTNIWAVNFQLSTNLINEGFKIKYKIKAIDKGLIPHISFLPDTGYFTAVFDTLTFINNYETKKIDFALYQNYPNPFNPTTTIGYRLKESGYVKLMVYNILGKLVKVLVNKFQSAGYYEVEFGEQVASKQYAVGNSLASGIYIYRIEVIGKGNVPVFSDMRKMVLLK